MRTHAQRPCPAISAYPPQQDGGGQEKPGQYPPAAFCQRDKRRPAIFRPRRVKAEPEELANKFHRIPVYRREHVEADNLDCEKTEHQRGDAKPTQIDRADLCLPEFAHPIAETGHFYAAFIPSGQRHTHFRGVHQLNLGEYILISCHFYILPLRPNRYVAPPFPPLRPAARVKWSSDNDAHRTPEASV